MSLNNLSLKSTIDAVMPVKVLSSLIFDYYYLSPLELDNELIITYRKKMLKKTKKIFNGIVKYSGYPLTVPKRCFNITAPIYYDDENNISLLLTISYGAITHLINYQSVDRASGSIYYSPLPESDDDDEELLKKKYVCSVGNKRLKYSAEFNEDCLDDMIHYLGKYFLYPSSNSDSNSDSN